MFERELRNLAYVPRWGIVRVLRNQNVAEHSFYVAIYADQIAELIDWGGDRAMLLRLALSHDWDEILTSDVAAPAKKVIQKSSGFGWAMVERWLRGGMRERVKDYDRWNSGVIEEKGPEAEAHTIVKLADLLEAILYLADEQNMGNGNVIDRRIYLEDVLWASISKLDGFSTKEQRIGLVTQMRSAIARSVSGTDKIVTGKEVY